VTAAPGEREVVVFGIPSSVYVQSVRLALAEKGVAHRVEPVDPFTPGGPPAEHLARQPFGKIPAFRHGDFALYEASAIARYVDDAFAGPTLQPEAPRERARMNQAIGILDAYAYRALVWDLYVERFERPGGPDASRIARAVPRAATCLRALDALVPGAAWLAGGALSLADLHAAPIFAYFTRTPESDALLAPCARLARWWEALRRRESVRALCLAAPPR
jgi:glutathione S-transferase